MTDKEMAEQFADNINGFESTCSLLSVKDKSHAYRLGRYEGFLAGLEADRSKANEWHYVKDGDIPNVETKNYTYIRRRKRYERHFTDYRVIKCFVLYLNEKGKTTAGVGYFDCNRKCFLDEAEGVVYAWKEIVLPELKESE